MLDAKRNHEDNDDDIGDSFGSAFYEHTAANWLRFGRIKRILGKAAAVAARPGAAPSGLVLGLTQFFL